MVNKIVLKYAWCMSEKTRKFDQISIQIESRRNITKIVSSRNIKNVSAIASTRNITNASAIDTRVGSLAY